MALAIFDLDNTLIDGDSDYLWGIYLSRLGMVDGKKYEAARPIILMGQVFGSKAHKNENIALYN